LGLRLRLRLELARCLHRLPAAQDRGGRQAETDPHGSRRRLRTARAGMSFRTRLALVAAVAVALAVVVASAVVFVVVRNQLRGQVDDTLRSRAGAIASSPLPPHPEQGPNGRSYLDLGPAVPRDTMGQLVNAAGARLRTFSTPALPVDSRAREAARDRDEDAYFADLSAGGRDYRVLAIPQGNGTVRELAR